MMTRPHEFQEGYIAIQSIPYIRVSPRDLGRSGVLAKGQFVWVRTRFDAERPISISAFVDHIGVVSLDPEWLVAAKFIGW